jgi:LL-H family phage holin
MKDLIMTILTAGIQLTILVGLGSLIDYLLTKTSAENLSKIYNLIRIFVQSAEQIYGEGEGVIKKKAVLDMISKTIKNKLSTEEIDKLIESAVFEINTVLDNKKIKTPEVNNSQPTATVDNSQPTTTVDNSRPTATVDNSQSTVTKD